MTPGTFLAENDDRLYWGRYRSAYIKLVDKDHKRNKLINSKLNKKNKKAEEQSKKGRNKNVIDNFIKIIEIHMRIIIKFKYVFTSKIHFQKKQLKIWKSGKLKKCTMSPFFGILNNSNAHNTFLSFRHIKGGQHNLKPH